RHPQYLGVYEGAIGREEVRCAVEEADCLLILGAFLTDIDLGVFTARLDVARTINAVAEKISIKHHQFERLTLRDFVHGLIGAAPVKRCKPHAAPKPPHEAFQPEPKRPLTVRRFFARMDDFLEDDFAVICDPGDGLFGAADLTIHRRTEFLSPAYYTSMGFAVPAAVGAQIRNKRLRPIVFVGDGAFQMTGQELSTAVRYGLNPIVFVLNNKGYTTERFIRDGPYNDIHEWAYHLLPELLRSGWGSEVRTEGELESALQNARRNIHSFSIINVQLDPWDHSAALERLGKRLGAQAGFRRRGTGDK
ncbi:MAG: thiamine pyrophosphate-dependent enzyme, partial [Planctomycetota bacterium]